jgi:hypothetical protein
VLSADLDVVATALAPGSDESVVHHFDAGHYNVIVNLHCTFLLATVGISHGCFCSWLLLFSCGEFSTWTEACSTNMESVGPTLAPFRLLVFWKPSTVTAATRWILILSLLLLWCVLIYSGWIGL